MRLTCVSAFVYFEILRPGKHFATPLERARERFFPGVHPDVVDQLVLGLERTALALASVPKARVRRALGTADVLDSDVRHDVLHRTEHLAARAHRRTGLVDPQARHVLERGGRHRAVSHVPVKRAARVTGPAAVRVLSAVIVVPVHRRGRLERRLRLMRRRRRIRLSVVQLQVVVHGRRVQTAHVMVAAVLVMVMVVVMAVVVVVGHVPADVQKVPGPRIARMVRRRRRRGWRRLCGRRLLLSVVHLMIVVLGSGHIVFLDLDAHAVDQRRVVHKRV